MKTLAILVGGGTAPGINAVIAAATIEARNHGLRVLGCYDGFRWLLEGDSRHVTELTTSSTPTCRLIKLNGKAGIAKGDPYSPLLCPVEYAVKTLRAVAVGYTLYPGSEHEGRMFAEFAEVVRQAQAFGVPTVAWVYPRGKAVQNDTAPEIVAYAARIVYELGADIAKVKWSGTLDSFRWVCAPAVDTRVVLSGGVLTEDPREFLDVADKVMKAGGAGVAVGRNVWQRPRAEAAAISRDIVARVRA